MASLGIDRLSTEDRIRLVDEILESLPADREPPPLTEAQARELDRRLARLESGESKTTAWKVVYERLQEKRGR